MFALTSHRHLVARRGRPITRVLALRFATLLATGVTHAQERTPGVLTVVTNDAATWAPLYGEKMWDFYHPDWQGYFPGGRSNRFHEQYAQGIWRRSPWTKDWQIMNRAYVFEGEWFAVEWFYRATSTADGFRQWEGTLGIGRLKEGKLVSWTEYFDDSVGNLQRMHLMPFYDAKEPVFPWPAKATLRLPYRP